MMTRIALRATAVAIAVAAMADPALRRMRNALLSIEVRTEQGLLVPPSPAAGVAPDALAARAQLAAGLAGNVVINTAGGTPAATVVLGDRIVPDALPASGPVFFIVPATAATASVVATNVRQPRAGLPGWTTTVAAHITARGVAPGSASTVILESHGAEVDRVEHRWGAANETFEAKLTFTPPSAGTFPLQVRVTGPAGSDTSGASARTRVLAESRRLRVLAFDPRPSWASGFVRRALERDPDFDVVTRVGASTGLEVRTGPMPDTIAAGALESFDVVLIGAPENLTSGEVAALDSFARARGGAVVFIADRRPSGPYASLVAAGAFEETLVEKPVALTAADGTGLRASELVYPWVLPAGAEPLLTIPHAGAPRAVLLAVPRGQGRVLFSGALDAWRYRADDGERFERFWRSAIGREALASPRRIELMVEPGAAAAGQEVLIRAVVRATEFERVGERVSVPALGAEVIDARGGASPVRLWPGAERGLFEGRFTAALAGRFIVRARTEGGVSAESPLTVEAVEPRSADHGRATAAVIATASGGAVLPAGDVAGIRDALRALPRAAAVERWQPMRSAWWAMAFTLLLCAEWALRRRGGLR